MGATASLSSGEQDMFFCLLLPCYCNQGVSAFLQLRFENRLLPCLAAFKVGAEEPSVSVLAVLQEQVGFARQLILSLLYLYVTDLQQLAQTRQEQGEHLFGWQLSQTIVLFPRVPGSVSS